MSTFLGSEIKNHKSYLIELFIRESSQKQLKGYCHFLLMMSYNVNQISKDRTSIVLCYVMNYGGNNVK